MVEVIVAIVVLEIGVLGVMGTLLLASRTMAAAEVRERAVLEARRVADSLWTEGVLDAGARATDWGEVTWTSPGEGYAVEVVARNPSGDTLVSLMENIGQQ